MKVRVVSYHHQRPPLSAVNGVTVSWAWPREQCKSSTSTHLYQAVTLQQQRQLADGDPSQQRQHDFGGQQQQRGAGGHSYLQQHPHQPQQQRQHQQRAGGTGPVGNTRSGWYQPVFPPTPGASMGEAYKRDRCGALGHKSGICRAPNAFAGTCGTCGAHANTARQCRTAPPTRMHATPHGPPAPLEHYSSVPLPVAWPQQQGGLGVQGDEWDGGGMRGGAQQ